MMTALQDLKNKLSTSGEIVFSKSNKKYRTYFVSIKAEENKYLSNHDYLNLSQFSWAAYWEVVAVSESMGRQMRSSTCLIDRLTAVSV